MDYTITLKFSTDRELTRREMDTLEYVLCPQIEEPVVEENGDLVDAEYSTTNVTFKIEK